MSVLKRNRKESTLEFINTAIELEVFILKECSKFPKRYFYILWSHVFMRPFFLFFPKQISFFLKNHTYYN